MRVSIVYFDDCPNWRMAKERVDAALAALDRSDVAVELVRVDSEDDARRAGLHGSPTVLIDGRDPFAPPDAPTALACRAEGAPTVDQLLDILRSSGADI
jgi:hypothetical protein